MIDKNLLNPFNTDPAMELPHTPQDMPLWTEYCYFHGHDPVVDTGISLHMGREPYDSQIWRATLAIYMPGGEDLLVVKTSGRNGHSRGGGTGPLKVACVEPFRLWTVEFDGSVQHTTRTKNMAAAHPDSISEPAKLFLRFEGAAPMWDLHQFMEGQPWASGHWEQICRVTGEITYRGKTYSINGGGVRDHSHGPRDYGPVLSNFWTNMLFPSGAAIMAQTVRMEDVEIRNGYIFRNDGSPLEIIEVVEIPFIATLDTPPASVEKDPLVDDSIRNFTIVIKTKAGLEKIECELIHSVATTYISPNDELLGTDFTQLENGQPRVTQLTESVCKFHWNGETGIGNRERIARISTLK